MIDFLINLAVLIFPKKLRSTYRQEFASVLFEDKVEGKSYIQRLGFALSCILTAIQIRFLYLFEEPE